MWALRGTVLAVPRTAVCVQRAPSARQQQATRGSAAPQFRGLSMRACRLHEKRRTDGGRWPVVEGQGGVDAVPRYPL